jgi:hypothetical protein
MGKEPILTWQVVKSRQKHATIHGSHSREFPFIHDSLLLESAARDHPIKECAS